MFNAALRFLRDDLRSFLKRLDDNPGPIQEPVEFPQTENGRWVFPSDCVTVLLLHTESEGTLRPADLFTRTTPEGQTERVMPEIRLNLLVLLAAACRDYESALQRISNVVRYVQRNHLLTRASHPSLPEGLDRLTIELVPLSWSDQKELWSTLQSPCLPSVVVRIRSVVFRDPAPTRLPEITSQALVLHPRRTGP